MPTNTCTNTYLLVQMRFKHEKKFFSWQKFRRTIQDDNVLHRNNKNVKAVNKLIIIGEEGNWRVVSSLCFVNE